MVKKRRNTDEDSKGRKRSGAGKGTPPSIRDRIYSQVRNSPVAGVFAKTRLTSLTSRGPKKSSVPEAEAEAVANDGLEGGRPKRSAAVEAEKNNNAVLNDGYDDDGWELSGETKDEVGEDDENLPEEVKEEDEDSNGSVSEAILDYHSKAYDILGKYVQLQEDLRVLQENVEQTMAVSEAESQALDEIMGLLSAVKIDTDGYVSD
jgi:hypothetical protein